MKKHQRTLSTGVVVLLGLLFAYFWKGEINLGKTLNEQRSTHIATPKETKSNIKEKVQPKAPPKKPIFVKGPKGPEDISGTLYRIEKGEKFHHRNDGGIFHNREKRLPLEKRGYYHEFVHPTRGGRGPGPQRIVVGDKKEIFYTPDHYKTFQRVKND